MKAMTSIKKKNRVRWLGHGWAVAVLSRVIRVNLMDTLDLKKN